MAHHSQEYVDTFFQTVITGLKRTYIAPNVSHDLYEPTSSVLRYNKAQCPRSTIISCAPHLNGFEPPRQSVGKSLARSSRTNWKHANRVRPSDIHPAAIRRNFALFCWISSSTQEAGWVSSDFCGTAPERIFACGGYRGNPGRVHPRTTEAASLTASHSEWNLHFRDHPAEVVCIKFCCVVW